MFGVTLKGGMAPEGNLLDPTSMIPTEWMPWLEWMETPGFWALMTVLVIWQISWDGYSLWHAARNKQTGWFIAILLTNTLGILEIIYLQFFQKDLNPKPKKTTSKKRTTAKKKKAAPKRST
jgi:hypothetical protein